MGQKTNKTPRTSALQGSSLRNAAARLVAARFSGKSRATLPAKSATRLAGYSTVTASGASAAGLDRCAYTLGKWQNNIITRPQTAGNSTGRINDHLQDFIGKPETAAMRSDENTALVVRLDRLERRCEQRQAAKATGASYATQSSAETLNKPSVAPSSRAAINTDDYLGEDRRLSVDRREYSLKTLWHCLSNPRRSKGRRKSDTRYPLLDVFDGSAMFLAVALTVLSLCDAFFTLNILAQGGREVNPVMNYMLGFGTFAFVASKMLLTALAAIVLTGAGNLKIFNRIRVRSVIATLIGLYAGLIVYELLILSMA